MSDFNVIAKNVNKKYFFNKCLQKKLELYNNYNILTKETIVKFFYENKNSSLYFNQYFNEIKKICESMKKENDNLLSKYYSLLDECRNDLIMGKPILAQKRNKKFFLEYLIIEKKDVIKSLKSSIKLSRDSSLFREQKRDNYTDIQKGNKEIENEMKEKHQNMLYECKKSNKLINKIKKYELKRNIISNNIKILNIYIEKYNIKNSNCGDIYKKKKNFTNKIFLNDELEINIDDDKRNKKIKKYNNKVIKDFFKIEDLFDISQEEGESEGIIDDELHSDDETLYENKINQQYKLSTDYLKNIKKLIPTLNFKQIKFNNKKKDDEIDLYSMERRKYIIKNVYDKIKEIKKKIGKINYKLASLKQKEKKMREFIKKLKGNYNSVKPIFYQNSQTYEIQQDYIIKSLNVDSKKRNAEYDNFLDDIPEIEEKYYNENEKSEDKKETKDTRKEEDELKKNIFKSVLENKIKPLNNKRKRKKLLISLNGNFLKNSIKENYERPKSK